MNYPALAIFLTMMWFFLWILWLFLLVRVGLDVFRDGSLSGWAKAGWIVLLIIFPFLGVLIYVIARGSGMSERTQQRKAAAEEEFRDSVRSAAEEAPGSSPATEITKLADLKDRGVITEEEFQQAKSKLLAA
jgi:hypothetical protein